MAIVLQTCVSSPSEIEQHRPGTHRVAVMVVMFILADLDEERCRVRADGSLPEESSLSAQLGGLHNVCLT